MEKVYVGIMLIAVAIAVLAIAVAIKESACCRKWKKHSAEAHSGWRHSIETIELRNELLVEKDGQIAELQDACEKHADEVLRLEEKREDLMRENVRLSCILHGEIHSVLDPLPSGAEIVVVDDRKFYVREGEISLIFEDGKYAGWFRNGVAASAYEAPRAEIVKEA